MPETDVHLILGRKLITYGGSGRKHGATTEGRKPALGWCGKDGLKHPMQELGQIEALASLLDSYGRYINRWKVLFFDDDEAMLCGAMGAKVSIRK